MFSRPSLLYHISVLHFFLWLNNIPLQEYTTFYILLSVDGHFGYHESRCYEHLCPCFHADMYYYFSWVDTRGGNAQSYSTSMHNHLRNDQTVFQSSRTSLYSPPVHDGFSFSIPLLTLVIILLCSAAIVVGMKWYFIVVLILISLMVNDIEHLFMCLLAICISSLEKCLFGSFAYFFSFGCLSFHYWAVSRTYTELLQVFYQIFNLQILFSHSVVCFFTFLMVSLETWMFNFKVQLICFCFCFFAVVCAFDVLSRKPFPNPKSWGFTPMFSSKFSLLFCFLSPHPRTCSLILETERERQRERQKERQREREGEKHRWEKETSISCLLYAPEVGTEPTTQACDDWELNPWPFGLGDDTPTNWATWARPKLF